MISITADTMVRGPNRSKQDHSATLKLLRVHWLTIVCFRCQRCSMYLEKVLGLNVYLLTRVACGSRLCARCGILHWCLGKCTIPIAIDLCWESALMNPGQPRPSRYLQRHPNHVLAARHHPPRIRNARLQTAPAAAGPHQESDEGRPGSEDDLG